MNALRFVLVVSAGLAACAAPEPQTRANAARAAACREHADEVYLRQNRAELYRSDAYATSTRDAPFATSGIKDDPTRGLAGRYARDTMVGDCMNATGGTPGTSPTTAPGAKPTPLARGQTPAPVPQ